MTQKEFLRGIDENLQCLSEDLKNCDATLKLLSTVPISISDIEHQVENRLIAGKPKYFSTREFEEYYRAFGQFYNRSHDFYILLTFEYRIGNIIRTIRLFHLSGEALATYDVLFLKQDIAPKIYITIQTNKLELPDGLSNELFKVSKVKPKVWLRGRWSNNEDYLDFFSRFEFSSPNSLFNVYIGEFINWKICVANQIEGTTDNKKNLRIVRAYGEPHIWNHPKSYMAI
jgi:hypothetical protein